MMKIAQMLVNGEELASGMDLGLEGYESVQQSPDVPTTWYGSAWVIVDKDNAADYPF
jgi:simple sugar transport system substrate-binding protein